MKFGKSNFKNDWYPIVLLIYVSLHIITQLSSISSGFGWVNIINLIIVSCVLISIPSGIYPHIIVRVAGLVIFIGGCLGMISILLFLISGTLQMTHIGKILNHILNIAIGFVIYRFYDSSIVEETET